MNSLTKLAAVAAAAGLLAVAPHAAAATPSDAAKLRRLDIMLMVSSLRCRFGADNFQADYARFSTNQYPVMQDAFRTMEADYKTRMGPAQAKKALDSVSVGMANEYGVGHPWLGCGELKSVTRELAATQDRGRLIAAADEMLGDRPPQIASRR